jgi:hypothetical protein
MEFINEQDEATLQRFVERLEFRGRDPKFDRKSARLIVRGAAARESG